MEANDENEAQQKSEHSSETKTSPLEPIEVGTEKNKGVAAEPVYGKNEEPAVEKVQFLFKISSIFDSL